MKSVGIRLELIWIDVFNSIESDSEFDSESEPLSLTLNLSVNLKLNRIMNLNPSLNLNLNPILNLHLNPSLKWIWIGVWIWIWIRSWTWIWIQVWIWESESESESVSEPECECESESESECRIHSDLYREFSQHEFILWDLAGRIPCATKSYCEISQDEFHAPRIHTVRSRRTNSMRHEFILWDLAGISQDEFVPGERYKSEPKVDPAPFRGRPRHHAQHPTRDA